MVCPIKKGNGLHYVIVRKHKHQIEIYDSADGNYRTNLKDFAEKFVGIVMLISKSSTKINIDRLPKLDL
jgi:ABC-type bacteriocin/lantibiotic exporter with double-glycine peptidase domain